MGDEAGTLWLTYAEMAEVLGLPTVAAAAQRARRSGWARQAGNDGKARVAVPRSILPLEPPPSRTAHVAETLALQPLQAELDALRAEVAEQREARARAEGEAAALREAIASETKRADQADAARQASETLSGQIMHAVISQAEASAQALAREAKQLEQAEDARLTAEMQRDAAQTARAATQAELAAMTSGGPLARAWRAFLRR